MLERPFPDDLPGRVDDAHLVLLRTPVNTNAVSLPVASGGLPDLYAAIRARS